MVNAPAPDPSFRWSTESWGLALTCVPLAAVAQHLFTSAQLAFTPSAAEPSAAGKDPWGMAAGTLGATAGHLARVRQVHGSAVRVVGRGDGADAALERPDGDAVVSNEPGLLLAVVVADCVPILLADTESGAAAAIHAGWRGTCAGIVRAAVDAMVREFGTKPSNLTAAIGPSIGPEDYEVGDGVVEAFRDAGHDPAGLERWFIRRDGQRPHLDLWRANRDQLEGTGVPAGAISVCGLSTLRYPSLLESYRRDGPKAGRMAAIVKVPEPGA